MSSVRMLPKCLALVIIVAATTTSDAQDQERRRNRANRSRGGRSSASALLRIAEVQTELKITDEQKTALAEMPRLDRAAFRDLSREERAKKLADYRKQVSAKIQETLNEEQRKRLNQLVMQRQGYRALGSAAVAKQLELSDEQQTKIRSVLNPQRDGQQRRNRQDESAEQRRARSAEREKSVLAVLTDAQKEKFEKMKGEKFEFPTRRRRSQ